ncbi:monofunctional biosynthetic peptidoglycan transglycosylase [Corticimicrobacter populi]|uniref:Biosynthetic peptidoglycan transglycosylase n=1 Tax=Corticimicrobacter populi TaxID=2175229 RepID=A0A2V1JXN2_9BURK|nr:monofunctional biosynthetic peptidoglycan transglycosylase [Corticimicrobacter populi]PWF22264.1 monofunctional biosynthetic peptidoglycan transglycosylase [Corticimicrobacter populi]
MTGIRHPWLHRIMLALMALACLFLLAQFWFFAQVIWYQYKTPARTPIMQEQLDILRDKRPDAELQYRWVDYDRISASLKRAVIAAEDANFMQHGGIEWEAIRKAWDYNRQQREDGSSRVRGGSTITQQLAKNLFLSGTRSYLRKAQEMILAYMIEHVMDKERILELYLNVAEWGNGIFGAEAAARHYFGTSAAQLSSAQAARLAAMLPNPRYYDQHRNTRYLNGRTATLQQRMRMVDIP